MAQATASKGAAKKPSASKLPAGIFDVPVKNHETIRAAYEAYLANGRQASAKTKTRAMVSGGGRKPWRQKGTGRARAGSIRSPIWRSGGVTFGPTGNENYTRTLSQRSRQTALKQALTLAAGRNAVLVIDDVKTTGKTAEIASLLKQHGADRATVLVVADKTEALVRASNNIPNLLVTTAAYLNVYQAVNADTLLFEKAALVSLEERLKGEAK